MMYPRRFHALNLLIWLLLVGCSAPVARSGTGIGLGDRPTLTPAPAPTSTATPTQAPTQVAQPTPSPTNTQPAEAVENDPTATPSSAPATITPTPSPTPPFETILYTNESLKVSFELPESWVIDENLELDGVIQIADGFETLYSGSVRRGALITITGLPNIAQNLTEWIAAVTGAFKENYLLDDSQTSLTTPFEINGYAGLRVEQRGGYTVTDPPEAVSLIIVAIEHNGWLVTIATGARDDQMDLVEAQFDHLVRTLKITAESSADSDQ
ncbi:MAG: hypothetical protein AB8G95_30550 [Anaerolineae bacterium]